MHRIFTIILLGALMWAAPALRAGDANLLAGKWSVRKVNHQYHSTSQTLEIKGNKFVFQMLDKDGEVVLHAEGDLKLEKLGPFNLARFVNIRGGESSSSLEQVDDEYSVIYVLEGELLVLGDVINEERWITESKAIDCGGDGQGRTSQDSSKVTNSKFPNAKRRGPAIAGPGCDLEFVIWNL